MSEIEQLKAQCASLIGDVAQLRGDLQRSQEAHAALIDAAGVPRDLRMAAQIFEDLPRDRGTQKLINALEKIRIWRDITIAYDEKHGYEPRKFCEDVCMIEAFASQILDNHNQK